MANGIIIIDKPAGWTKLSKKGKALFLTKFAVCYAHNLFADGEQIPHLQPEKYFRSGTRPGRK